MIWNSLKLLSYHLVTNLFTLSNIGEFSSVMMTVGNLAF